MSGKKNELSADPSFGKDLLADVIDIVRDGRESAYTAVNANAIETYWRVGKRIVEEEQMGRLRAEYGTRLLRILSKELTLVFGKGFTERNLRNFRLFHVQFPDLEIWHTRVPNLTLRRRPSGLAKICTCNSFELSLQYQHGPYGIDERRNSPVYALVT